MTKVTITVTGLEEVLKNLSSVEKKIETGAERGVNDSVTMLRGNIVENYLSGQSLNVVTNNLRSGITEHSAEKTEAGITGAVSSTATAPGGFDYGEYHEFKSGRSFMGPAFYQKSPDMNRVIEDRIKKALK